MKCRDCPISEDAMDCDEIWVCMLDTDATDNRSGEDECCYSEEDFDDLIQALQAVKRMMLRDKEANVCD